MKGDFSRFTFDPKKHYTSVRMQQGRVQLDADWNEQTDILVHLLRAQIRDLLGGHGAPELGAGFELEPVQSGDGSPDLRISQGRYYVDGILVENDSDVLFSEQPHWPGAALPSPPAVDDQPESTGENGGSNPDSETVRYVAYLDIWERDVCGAEDPTILEPALDGLDTTTRTQLVWQVKLWNAGEPQGQTRAGTSTEQSEIAGDTPSPPSSSGQRPDGGEGADEEKRQAVADREALSAWQTWTVQQAWSADSDERGTLQARLASSSLGLTNQLYRVEIHSADESEVSFKWSRENGSVAYPIAGVTIKTQLAVSIKNAPDLSTWSQGDSIELLVRSQKNGETQEQVLDWDLQFQAKAAVPPQAGETTGSRARKTNDPTGSDKMTSLLLSTGKALTREEVEAKIALAGPGTTLAIRRIGRAGEQPLLEIVDPTCRSVLELEVEDMPQLSVGDWVELVDDQWALNNATLPLFQVRERLDRDVATFGLELAARTALSREQMQPLQKLAEHLGTSGVAAARHPNQVQLRPLVRRWDHQEYAHDIQLADDGGITMRRNQWLPLENGIEVCFGAGGAYHVGDYWFIPARSVADVYTIDWPNAQMHEAKPSGDESTEQIPPTGSGNPAAPGPAALPPRGIDHHYAPLAVLRHDGTTWRPADYRARFENLTAVRREELDEEQEADRLREQIVKLRAELAEQRRLALEVAGLAGLLETFEAVTHPDQGPLQPGEIVSLIPETTTIERAARDNAAMVFGVVVEAADRPKTGDELATGKTYRIAHYGRIECLVAGRIEPGDLLVPSETPGCAMAAGILIQPGTIIGKALQHYPPKDRSKDRDQPGLIPVLVTLR